MSKSVSNGLTSMLEVELRKIYNKIKIRINPLDYTLKERVLLDSAVVTNKNTPYGFNYESETFLMEKLCDGECCPMDKVIPTTSIDVCFTNARYLLNECIEEFNRVLVYKNNISISIMQLETFVAMLYSAYVDIETIIKHTNLVQCFLYILEGAKNGLIPVLKHLDYSLDDNYSDVVDAKYIDAWLGRRQFPMREAVTDPFIVLRDLNNISRSFTGYTSSTSITVPEDDLKKVLKELLLYRVFKYTIELLHILETKSIPDLEKNIIYELLSKDYEDSDYMKMLYTFDDHGNLKISEYILKIVLERNVEIRYNLIKACLEELLSKNFFKDAVSKVNKLPLFLQYVCMMMDDYSEQCIRINNIKKLLDVCKERKIDINTSTDAGDFDLSFLDSLTGSGMDADVSEGMLDSFTTYSEDLSIPSSEDSPVKSREYTSKYDALKDSDFRDSVYSFEVKNVFDNSDSLRDKYNAIAESVSLINKNLIKKIKDIKCFNTGGKESSKKVGKLDSKNLYKYEQTDEIFYNNNYKIKESDLAFGIILDVSGSMSGMGIKNGVITMIVLHETLKALNINHSIITHTSHGQHNCIIDSYQSFKEHKNFNIRKNYALAGITAHSGNCDSASLYYMEQLFKIVKNKDKICLIFSDGEPTECTDRELRDQVIKMEKKGIKVIGIGINYPKIKEYYSENANGKNLREMLDIVSNILKRYVLEKKD